MTTEEILKGLPRNESSRKLVSEWLAALSDGKDETISRRTDDEGSGHIAEDELTDSGSTASRGGPRSKEGLTATRGEPKEKGREKPRKKKPSGSTAKNGGPHDEASSSRGKIMTQAILACRAFTMSHGPQGPWHSTWQHSSNRY